MSSGQAFVLRLLFIVLVTMAVVPSALSQGGDGAPKVEAVAQGGFGRIKFDWPSEVAGRGVIADGVLIIRFDQPFDADTDELARALEPYVALVRQDSDRRTLRLALKGPARLKTTKHGARLIFDLVPPSFAGDPPPPAQAANKELKLVVRAEERERVTRLRFTLPEKIAHSATLNDGKMVVAFAKTAQVDLGRIAQSPPARIRGVRSEIVDGKLKLEFDVDAEAALRDVSANGEIVLELGDPPGDSAAARTAATAAPKILIPDVAEGAIPPPPAPVADKIAFALPPRNAVAPALEVVKPVAQGDAAVIQRLGAVVPPNDLAPGDPNPLPPALRHTKSDLEAALAPVTVATPAGVPGQARAEFYGSMLRLGLPYSTLPAAAVFRRGLAIWFVAASSEAMNLDALDSLPNTPVRVLSAATEVAPGITAFRLEAAPSMSVSVKAAGSSWILSVGDTVPEVPTQLQLVRQTSGASTQLRAFLPGAQHVIWLKDPQAQDRIAVVLSHAPARGLASGRSFVEFAALPSQQGLAVQAVADDLTVTVEGSEAVVARPKGLNISDAQFARAVTRGTPVINTGASPAYVDFVAWGKPVAATRAESVRKLLQRSAESSGGMSAARMALARYYIAEGLAAEALGVLRNVAREDVKAEATPSFRVARAVANILMSRPREALADLSMEDLNGDAHAALWRGLAAYKVRDWRLARSNLMTALKVVNRYPTAWQARARSALATAALALNEPENAKQVLAGMPAEQAPVDADAEAKLVRAGLDAASKKIDAAIAGYDALANSPYRPVAARAKLEATLLRAAHGKTEPAGAIDELERLRFQWRGDETELKTLTELGKLYVAQNRVRDGLNTMRLAVRHFSTSDEARATAAHMAKIFEGLFLGGKADQLPPIQALAVFYDFRELTPVGSTGDEMIRRLADRLVSVDLLPQAAELLQHQVDNRLDGVAKASVATQLSLIYLLDRKAEKALAAIRGSKQTQLPDELIAQRNLIEARALADLRLYDEATDLIAADLSVEADRLRADVYWEAQRWSDAAVKAEAILGARFQGATPLTQGERDELMRACVAYSLAGDSASLERLRTRFGPKMAQSPDAKAFAVLTQAADVTSDSYKSLVKRVGSADNLRAFLDDFRIRYGLGGVKPAAAAAPAATTAAVTN